MLGSLRNFFQERLAPSVPADDAQRLRIATCALLLEAAHADAQYVAAEREQLVALIGARFELSAAEADELLHVADAERDLSGDLYQFARLVNESFSRERKLAVLDLMWRVVFSDGVLEAHEDALMHKMGTLLGIRHEELMALKLQVKRQLDQ